MILVPRHRLGDEQVAALYREHGTVGGGFIAAVWRGRHAEDRRAPDPEHAGKFLKMCRRSDEVEDVEKAALNVERHMCKKGRRPYTVECPLYRLCGYQHQKMVEANIWFGAHELLTHKMPPTFDKVGLVIIDELPLDAFLVGVDINDQKTLPLDILHDGEVPSGLSDRDAETLLDGREQLYRELDELTVPIDIHHGAPVPRANLIWFGGGGANAKHLRRMELKGKVVPDIFPDMTANQVRKELAKAAGNGTVMQLALLWQLVDAALNVDAKLYGRIQVHRGEKGRVVRMVGLRAVAEGWNVRTLICDATGDAELLRYIWPDLQCDTDGWQQLPRPASVRVFQCVNRSLSKYAIAIESKHEKKEDRDKEIAHKAEGARRMYAAMLAKALEYGGADVGFITYKSTQEWIEANCFVPHWLKLAHFGASTGTNAFQTVRALFVVGRPLASPEDIARQAEALTGEYVAERTYQEKRKHGKISIVPNAAAEDTVLVDARTMAHPTAERLRRQVTEGALVQTGGRARAGLRGETDPLDLHLWTDVAVPELGEVEPVLWQELATNKVPLSNAAETEAWVKQMLKVQQREARRR